MKSILGTYIAPKANLRAGVKIILQECEDFASIDHHVLNNGGTQQAFALTGRLSQIRITKTIPKALLLQITASSQTMLSFTHGKLYSNLSPKRNGIRTCDDFFRGPGTDHGVHDDMEARRHFGRHDDAKRL